MLATSAPSHGAQAFLYVIATVLFVISFVVAWWTPMLNKAVALASLGLAVTILVFAWIQIAVS